MKWHCPADTGFEIQALAVWGRAPYLSITEAPQILKLYEWTRKKCQSGVRTRDLRLSKQTALTTAPGPPPLFKEYFFIFLCFLQYISPQSAFYGGSWCSWFVMDLFFYKYISVQM